MVAKAYYGSKISPHIIRSTEGFLICLAVPIARTGTQDYLAREIGLDSRGNDVVKVYRMDEDVFNPKVLASFEGKPFTEEHPSDWVTPESVEGLIKGVVHNVRRGDGEEKDLLLADIIIYAKQQIEEVENKMKREVSCGYECEYAPFKDGYKQSNIVGNHVALVSAGRAGGRVAIKDNKTSGGEKFSKEVSERSQNVMGAYRIPRRSKTSDFLKAVGLKAIAQDAEPEDMMEMVDELVDEKAQSEKDAEPIVIERESESDDGEALEEVKGQLAEVKDAINAILARDEDIEEEEFTEDEDEDALESLDALEYELGEEDLVEDDAAEEIASVEASPEEINDEDIEGEMTVDSILELARAMKPAIAAIPNVRDRKKAADSLAIVLRKHMKKASDKKSSDTNYSKMLNRSKDAEPVTTQDVGMMIAKKSNPHYKEVK